MISPYTTFDNSSGRTSTRLTTRPVPPHSTAVSPVPGGAADNVDQQPVAVGDEGLHEVAPCLCAGHKASSTIKPRCHS